MLLLVIINVSSIIQRCLVLGSRVAEQKYHRHVHAPRVGVFPYSLSPINHIADHKLPAYVEGKVQVLASYNTA